MLATLDRASVKELPSLSVRQPNVSGGTYGGRTQSRWLRAADGFAVWAHSIQDQQNQTLNQHDCRHPSYREH